MTVLNWSARRVLVTGGAGFVGSKLVRLLADAGARVVSFDDHSTGCPSNLPEHPNIEAVEGDARALSQVLEIMRAHDVELVFHCIGDTFVPEAYEFPERFFDVNLGTTLNVLRAAKETGVRRVLYVSSTEVYGETATARADESCGAQPLNTYAVSKLAADRLCHTYQLEHDLPVIVARIFNCYGPRATHPYIVPEIIRQLHEGPRLRLGNLEAERDLTYVEDTARALMAVMASSLPNGDVVNIGSGSAYSVASLVKRLARIMGVTDVRVELDPSRLRRRDIPRFCADNSKLRSVTGWQPHVSLDAGLERTVAWFRENGCRWPWMRCD